jgi:hypothetical protein
MYPPFGTNSDDSTAGVYFLRGGSQSVVGVFKPHDEEQGMPNNPKNRSGTGAYGIGLRENFKPGYGCIREWATYVMDVGNFAGVPPTVLVNCEHPKFNYRNASHERQPVPKFGSLQQFEGNTEDFENFGETVFSDLAVQKIALLDLRVLNCDRNSANILVKLKANKGSNEGFN